MDISESREFDMSASESPMVSLYTDGGYRTAINSGGFGTIMQCNGNTLFIYGGEVGATNNVMELTAVLAALRRLTVPCRVHIVSDSRYVVDAINLGWLSTWAMNNWRKSSGQPVQNMALWQEMWNYCQYHLITASWTKGHSGETSANQICDHLATIGMFKTVGQAVPGHLIDPRRM